MTREEAIEMLKKDKEQRGNCFISEALDMAIISLKQEPVLDKIRAEIEHYAEIGDVGFTRNLIPKDIVLGIIDKYKAESEDNK